MTRRSTSAFTLIELMAVVAILAVMMVISVGNLGGVTAAGRMDAAVEAVRSRMLHARGEALATSSQYGVVYEIGTGLLYLLEPDETGRVLNLDTYIAEHIREEWVLPRGVFIQDAALADEAYSQGLMTVFVGPLGTVTYHTVRLADGTGRQVLLEVSPLTGFVRRVDG